MALPQQSDTLKLNETVMQFEQAMCRAAEQHVNQNANDPDPIRRAERLLQGNSSSQVGLK